MKAVQNMNGSSGRSRRRAVFGALMAVGLIALWVPLAARGEAQALPQHGITFLKGCQSPTTVGDKMRCDFSIVNDQDPDTLTITSLQDVIQAAGGDDDAGNVLPQLDLAFTDGGSGSSFCDAGQNLCTLPTGSSISTKTSFAYHVVTGDDADNANPLKDQATLTWQDLCTSDAPNCPVGNQANTTGSQTQINKLPSATTTSIHNANHDVVTAIEAGETVHDFVSVTGAEGDPTPTGTVTVDWFDNGDCSGDPVESSDPTDLENDGTVDVTDFTETPAAGSFGFQAHYSGDPNFQPSTGECEPLAVVDAFITIAPDATNEVGAPHTFVVTVMQDTGDGSGFQPAVAAPVDFTLNDTNGSSHVTDDANSTCEGATDQSGQCTIVFTSSTTGQVVGDASVTLTLHGLSVTRDTATNPGPGGSGPATKTYVDASITIGPDATNQVNAPHTFVVTVDVDNGDGSGLHPAGGEHVDFTLDDVNGAAHVVDEAASTCDDAGPNTDATGQCTIVFTSPTTGQTIGNASVTVTIGDLTITRDTAANSGSGGSGPATKTWVDASIAIGPNGNNPVGAPHTFTVTVMKDNGDGDGMRPADGEHVNFTLTDTDGASSTLDAGSSTCDTEGANTDDSGQCTIVFTSTSAGTTTGNASVAVGIKGITVNRNTSANSGPGGSGPAVKTWFAPPPLPRTGTNTFDLLEMAALLLIAGFAFAGAGFLLKPIGVSGRGRHFRS